MRTVDAIAATAGFLSCAVVYAATDHGLDAVQTSSLVQEAYVIEQDIGQGFAWLTGVFENCYHAGDGAPKADRPRLKLLVANACYGGAVGAGPV
jgi:hypothetical protein